MNKIGTIAGYANGILMASCIHPPVHIGNAYRGFARFNEWNGGGANAGGIVVLTEDALNF